MSRATRGDVRPRGPNITHPDTASTGTTVCWSWLATCAQVSRSSSRLSATWNTMNVTVIATTPISRNTANTADERCGSIASSRHVTPTMRLDWIVKNANTFAALPSGEPPKNASLSAETNSWMTMPPATLATVARNHGCAHLWSTATHRMEAHHRPGRSTAAVP